MKLIKSLTLAVALTLPTLSHAEVFSVVDKSHTSIEFSVSHFGFSETPGRFKDFSGDVSIDTENPEKSFVKFSVDAASVDTGWEARDEHLRKDDFFAVDKHPEITFESTEVEKIDDNTVKVTGNLTMLGETKTEVFDVVINKIGTTPFSPKPVMGLTATATIDRTEYGMTYGAPGISTEIPVVVNMEVTTE